MTSTMNVSFSSAISSIDESTGEWDNRQHTINTAPLGGRIMQTDGLTEVQIFRYGLRVKYIDSIISRDEVLDCIKQAIDWVLGNPDLGLFPLRGNKAIKVTDDAIKRSSTYTTTVTCMFCSYLMVYPVSVGNAFYQVQFDRDTHELRQRLLTIDGATELKLSLDGLKLSFDSRYNNTEEVIEHIRTVMYDCVLNESFFPFMGSDVHPTFNFTSVDN